MNIMRTGLLLAAMTGLFLAVGYLIGGQVGMLIAFAISVATNFFAYWNSGNMVLRMHNAQEVDQQSAPDLYNMVGDLAQNANLPMPRVYVMHEDQPNAFATGRNPENGAVAVTTGLMQRLNREEIAGVIAHELAHIRNRDTLIIVQMAISRTREYSADRLGAEICGQPMALAGALRKISNTAEQVHNHHAEENPATAHMFIINPLSGERMDNLFSTHPNVENRIGELQAMANEWGTPGAERFRRDSVSRSENDYDGPWSNSQSDEQRGPWG